MRSISVRLVAAGAITIAAIVPVTASAQPTVHVSPTRALDLPARRSEKSAAPSPTSASYVVSGDLWLRSTPELRRAFLIGAANMIALESAYATREGTTPPPAGTRAARALEGMTLDEVSGRVTRWYEANPERRDLPVVGVIWIDMVKAVGQP